MALMSTMHGCWGICRKPPPLLPCRYLSPPHTTTNSPLLNLLADLVHDADVNLVRLLRHAGRHDRVHCLLRHQCGALDLDVIDTRISVGGEAVRYTLVVGLVIDKLRLDVDGRNVLVVLPGQDMRARRRAVQVRRTPVFCSPAGTARAIANSVLRVWD